MEKQQITVNKNGEGQRLDVFLSSIFNESTRSHLNNMIKNGYVLLNDKLVKSGIKLKIGDVISVSNYETKKLDLSPEDIDIDIVYEDDDLAVVNKPQGMVVHPANGNENNTLVNALLFRLKHLSSINGVIRPGIVHRIDKNTSGLLLIAKNDKSHVELSKQIQNKTCHRNYIALCNGNFKDDSGTIITNIARSKKDRKQMAVCSDSEGKKAITHYNVIKRYGDYTLVEFSLETGRTHQIRVHAKHIGHCIVGDDVYGTKNKFKLNGQLLHAYKIEFKHPTTNKNMTFTCPLPEYFQKVLNKLNNNKK